MREPAGRIMQAYLNLVAWCWRRAEEYQSHRRESPGLGSAGAGQAALGMNSRAHMDTDRPLYRTNA